MKPKVNCIILAAGISSRMKSYEPRSLLKIGHKTLIEHQVDTIRKVVDGRISLVTGFKTNKIIKNTKNLNIEIVENKHYNESTSFKSLKLSLSTQPEGCMVVNGDLFFDKKTIDLDYNESFIITNDDGQIKPREIGSTVVNDHVTILHYGLPTKWSQIIYFTNNELLILKKICEKSGNDKKLWFEIINQIIDNGGVFKNVCPQNTKIIEIDCMGDIKNENSNS